MNDLLRSGAFQVLGLRLEPRVQTRPTSHSGLKSEVGNQDILESSPESITLRPCCNSKDKQTLPFARKKISSCSGWPQTYLESRGCCQHFLTVLLCPCLRQGEVILTWKPDVLLTCMHDLCLFYTSCLSGVILLLLSGFQWSPLDLGNPSISYTTPSSHSSAKMLKERKLFSCRTAFTSQLKDHFTAGGRIGRDKAGRWVCGCHVVTVMKMGGEKMGECEQIPDPWPIDKKRQGKWCLKPK